MAPRISSTQATKAGHQNNSANSPEPRVVSVSVTCPVHTNVRMLFSLIWELLKRKPLNVNGVNSLENTMIMQRDISGSGLFQANVHRKQRFFLIRLARRKQTNKTPQQKPECSCYN